LQAARKAAAGLSLTAEVFEVSRSAEFEPAFRSMAAARAGGLLMLSSPLFASNPRRLADLALQNRLPAMNQFTEFAERGGFLAYGPDLQVLFRQAGMMTRRILGGLAPAQMPLDRPVRFRLMANLKTANALGLDVPPSFVGRADEVIE
jgi:putative ABC transport system substrate-binding protein